MKRLRFYFDLVSPHAYLAFERLPQALEGLSYEVSYQPVDAAGLLQHRDSKASSNVEPELAWEDIRLTARQHSVQLALPKPYPFNSEVLMCLALARARDDRTPSRHVCTSVLHHVWHGGGDACEVHRVQALSLALSPGRDPAGEEVKRILSVATADAAARGVFRVPTVEVDQHLFFGGGILDMLAAYLRGDPGSFSAVRFGDRTR